MKDFIVILISIVLLTGCGVDGQIYNVDRDKEYNVDTNLSSYVDTFISNWTEYTGQSHYVDDLVVVFRDEDYFSKLEDSDKVLGNCIIGSDFFPPLVRIRWSKWVDMGEIRRQNLINHELGHCLLIRDHKDRLMRCQVYNEPRNCYASIMNSNLIPTSMYLSNEVYYLTELYSITGDWVQ